jgi:hypothetical protein
MPSGTPGCKRETGWVRNENINQKIMPRKRNPFALTRHYSVEKVATHSMVHFSFNPVCAFGFLRAQPHSLRSLL